MGADARARELLAAGNESAAADALLVSSRSQLMSLDTSLQAFRAAEAEAHSDNRRAAVSRSHIALLAAAGLWLLGLIVFALVPRRITEIRTIAAPSVASPAATVPASHVDLADAARLTSDLARLTDPSRLSDALGRACAVLRARGAIVWLERGDELVAAAAFGYDSAVLQRLPPISRSADNATAAAWRKGEAQTVAGESGGYGAIVVPIPGLSEPLGAFAIEVPAGIEGDATVTSVATMVAAQLASVFAVWSTAPSAGAGPELDRQAAAS
jgi:hypothetical protein